jgi:hypothetical protein
MQRRKNARQGKRHRYKYEEKEVNAGKITNRERMETSRKTQYETC